MSINYFLLVSRQGKVRLARWFTFYDIKEKQRILKEVSQLVVSRKSRMCNFLEHKGWLHCNEGFKIVYKRYASLYFIASVTLEENELLVLEIIHRYVEALDQYFGNVIEFKGKVCELDLIFNFSKAYFILDELLMAGEVQESSKKAVLKAVLYQDSLEQEEQEKKR